MCGFPEHTLLCEAPQVAGQSLELKENPQGQTRGQKGPGILNINPPVGIDTVVKIRGQNVFYLTICYL